MFRVNRRPPVEVAVSETSEVAVPLLLLLMCVLAPPRERALSAYLQRQKKMVAIWITTPKMAKTMSQANQVWKALLPLGMQTL